jgi:hypothetical protein
MILIMTDSVWIPDLMLSSGSETTGEIFLVSSLLGIVLNGFFLFFAGDGKSWNEAFAAMLGVVKGGDNINQTKGQKQIVYNQEACSITIQESMNNENKSLIRPACIECSMERQRLSKCRTATVQTQKEKK